MTMTLEIPDDLLEKLNAAAAAQGTSPENVALRAIGEFANANGNGNGDDDGQSEHRRRVKAAGDYVQNKNAELYRRLA